MPRVLVLDGGLATQLEADGADLSGALWSARVLADEPERIIDAHAAFYAAGADVAISSSYQASFDGYARAGIDHERAVELMTRSVSLARSPGKLVAASVGPYGATLADGSEYTGDYGRTLDELRSFHRGRLAALASAHPDLLAVETIPSLLEVRAVCAELADLDVPAWISVTTGPDGTRTAAGDPLAEVFAVADGCDAVLAAGVNCVPPALVTPALAVAAATTTKPLVAYPNSGEGWDATARAWTGDAAIADEHVREWLDLGVRYVGGCCRVGPAQIVAVGRSVEAWRQAAIGADEGAPTL